MHRSLIAFATYDRVPSLTEDDRLVVPLLAELGIDVVPAIWSDERVDWRRFDAVVLRSTWDYHRRPGEFRRWLDRLETLGVPLWNPTPLARWNMDKRYLRDLAARGVTTVPTVWLDASGDPDLDAIMESRGWTDAVLKPVIAATSHRTVRVARGPGGGGGATLVRREQLAAILEPGAAMLQCFMPQVVEEGEWSLLFFAGEFSHAVMKRPRGDDFRVQAEFGGSADPVEPSTALIAAAARVLEAVEWPWLYARVDGVRGEDGGFVLMELEMLEPALFLGASGPAAQRFAEAIGRLVRR